VKDWWIAQPNQSISTELSSHPGILLVRKIREIYTSCRYNTIVMAAGFRCADEVVELARGGTLIGPDFVTIPPNLIDDLHRLVLPHSASDIPEPTLAHNARYPVYVQGYLDDEVAGKALFDRDLALEGVAADKLPEGLEKFSVDMDRLEKLIRLRIEAKSPVMSLL
jgi:transaldolase